MATIHLMTSTSESEDAQDESQLPILSKQAPITMPKLILERSAVRSVIGTEDIDPPSQPTPKKRARHALSTACRQHPARERSLPAHLAEYHVVSNQTNPYGPSTTDASYHKGVNGTNLHGASPADDPYCKGTATASVSSAQDLLMTCTARAATASISTARALLTTRPARAATPTIRARRGRQ